MELATAYIGVALDPGGVRTIASQAKAAGQAAGTAVGDGIKKGTDQGTREASNLAVQNLQGMGTRLRQAFQVTAVVAGLKGLIGAASDLNEEVSKSQVIFGDAAPQIREFAKGAEAIGQSETAALQAAGNFAVFGKAAGLAGQELADFSTKSVDLASDLASFFNTSPEQAVQAIGAAFRGESEPIRAYGVLLNEASLKQEALDQGLIKTTTGTLPPAMRVQAAYGLIMKQTTDAQGDFARTAEGVANKTRILQAQFENAKTELGQSLLPAFSQLLNLASLLIGVFNNLPGPIKTAVVAFVALAALRGPLGGMVDAVKSIGPALLSIGAAHPALIALTGVVLALTVIMSDSGQIVDEAKAAYKDFGKAVNDTSKEIVTSFSEFRKAAVAQDGITEASVRLGQSQDDLLRVLGDDTPGAIGTYVQSLTEAAAGNDEAEDAVNRLQGALTDIKWSEYIGAAAQFNGAMKELGIGGIAEAAESAGATQEQVALLVNGFKDGTINATILSQTGIPLVATMDAVRDALASSKEEAGGANQAFAELSNANDTANVSLQLLSDAFDGAKASADGFREALDKLIGTKLDEQAATDAAIASEAEINTAREKNGATLDENTEKGRANREVIRSSIEDQLAYTEAIIAGGASNDEAAAKLINYRERLIENATQFGLTREEAEAYVDQLGLTPESITTTVELAKLEEEKARLGTWLDGLEGIPKEKQTQIQALIDQGKIAEAENELNNLARFRTIEFGVRVTGGSVVADTVQGLLPSGVRISGTRAHGGPVVAGSLYRVNEMGPTRGPEFFVPNTDGNIVPLGDALEGNPAQATGATIYAGVHIMNLTTTDEVLRIFDERDRRLARILGS